MCEEGFTQGSPVFPPCVPSELPKVMGLKGIHHSQCTLLPGRTILLPLVQERRAEWGDSHQSFVDNALQIRTSLQRVSPLLPLLLLRPCSIMVKSAGSTQRVTPKKKTRDLMMTTHPDQTDLPQAIPYISSGSWVAGQTLSAMAYLHP